MSTEPGDTLASRIAARSLAKREANYANEVRRLLDAGRVVMGRSGTTARPRVADIVAEAGLSNEAFYRHFPSKDALVAAILEDGTERLHSYVAHQMSKASTAEARLRRWVEGVLSQADDESAETTRAVMWNAGSMGEEIMSSPPSVAGRLAALVRDTYAELGSADPEFDASLAAHATIGKLSDYLWRQMRPTKSDVDRITAFCLRIRTP
ncbi:TetR/AcrR family transcriptional regulator [Aldersonia kunmingensis]|uniref:TetR/AcrR family transcriptional regulator n=1 Tax=Aldersonia kunmingensis TaxID=408066 RepID=UPI0008311B03|nr:TetR/AcrR family transcriptional regulator [Aldersonia kunmingensis]